MTGPFKHSPRRAARLLPRALVTCAILMVLATLGLWLVSGRERLTKSAKPVTVAVADDLFGDAQPRVELKPGPIFGWYIGLDLVGVTIAAAFLAIGITVLVARLRSRSARKVQNATS